jgi:hypothetical protein
MAAGVGDFGNGRWWRMDPMSASNPKMATVVVGCGGLGGARRGAVYGEGQQAAVDGEGWGADAVAGGTLESPVRQAANAKNGDKSG